MKFFALLCGMAMIFSACSSEKQQQEKKITTAEQQLAKGFDESIARELAVQYDAYLQKYPEDKKSKEYLFRAANNYVNLREGVKAVQYFNSYMDKYPDDPKVPECLFTIGLTYESVLNDTESAIAAYTDFLRLFPDHELADDARSSIAILQDPLEFIHSLEAANDSVPVEHLP